MADNTSYQLEVYTTLEYTKRRTSPKKYKCTVLIRFRTILL